MIRGSILDEAKTIINGERQDTNGNPEDSFRTVGQLWSTYLNARFEEDPIDLDGKDVALLMTLFKIARETHQGKKDNLVDAAGYLGLAGDFQEEIECSLLEEILEHGQAQYGRFMHEPGT